MPSSASSSRSPHPNITVRRRRRSPVETDLDGKENSNEQEELSQLSIDKVLRQFRQAAEKTCQASFWKDKSKLAALVVRASLDKNYSNSKKEAMISKSDGAALLSSARKVIKEATEQESKIQPCLYVGLHTLRSLTCREPDRLEAVIKCLYHIIVTGESAKEGDKRLAEYSLVAYESLGQICCDDTCSSSNDETNITAFQMPSDCSHQVLQGIFPIPVARKTTNAPAIGSLTIEQLMTIGIRSNLAVARILCKMITDRDKPFDQEFKRSLWNRMRRDNLHQTFDCVVHIIRRLLPPWISLFAVTGQVEGKDVQHYCKTGYQILLQAAAASNDSEKRLELQKQAIFALLGVSLAKNVQPCVAKKFFDQGCNSAYKHSAIHIQEAKISCPVSRSHCVAKFHKPVGLVLDDLAGSYTSQSYMDYCAIRALHVGIQHAETTQCSSPRCIFRRLEGGRYAHLDCEKDVDAATMALYFMSLQVINDLEAQTTSTLISECRRITDHFATISNQCSYRHFKLLCSTALHRRTHAFISQQADASGDEIRIRRGALEATAIILGSCMSPLATINVDAEKLEHARDSFYWCFRGALGVLELLFSASREQKYLLQSDNVMRSNIDEVFSSVGRKRIGITDNCIECLAKVCLQRSYNSNVVLTFRLSCIGLTVVAVFINAR
jgi:hypothetical protein